MALKLVRAVAIAMLLVLTSQPDVQADETSVASCQRKLRPMIEVGGGVQSANDLGDVRLLLRVGVGAVRNRKRSTAEQTFFPNELVWVHIKGDVAVMETPEGYEIPYLDLGFSLVEDRSSLVSRREESALLTTAALFPAEIKRNFAIGQDWVVQVSLVGVEFEYNRKQFDSIAAFAAVAIDALGYKSVSRMREVPGFDGAHVLGFGMEAGIRFLAASESHLRIALGGHADLNLGKNETGGFSVQSDLEAYLAARVDLSRFFQLYFKVGYSAEWESGADLFESSPQMIGGALFIF